MTRVARSTSASARRVDSVLHARWRVGLCGSLELTIAPAVGVQGDGLAVASVVLTSAPALVLGASRWTLLGALEESGLEAVFVVHSVTQAENGAPEAASCPLEGFLEGSTVTVCDPSSDSPLVLTDLPQRLGLKGGTYVLESIHARF